MEAFYRASYANAPQAVLKRIPDSYHFIMFDQPEVFQRELRTFLSGS
jgi:pimeloyl-ACP methyl ester carboxylesterase